MGDTRGSWHEGQQAWGRLEGWYQDPSLPLPGDAADGQRALSALEDSGLVRRLLDQVEFEAVRTARRNGKSWAEIAVKLGVTRQSAWERWRDVDESASGQPNQPAAGRGRGEPSATVTLRGTVRNPGAEALDAVSAELTAEAARAWRRRSSVVVPNVTGMSYDEARKVLQDKSLVAASPDPDGPPIGALGWPNGVVVDQSPESGAVVPPGSPVRLWVERGDGGGSGVREPRRPLPDPKSGHRMRDEATDETVS